jgi:predicted nucleic acid-binding protein
MFTIDASVWVNADSPAEAEQPASRALLDALFGRGVMIFEPTLLPVELAGVIARVRGDAELAQAMSTALVALPSIQWVALDDALVETAVRLAATHRLRGADAVYAAVAQKYDCKLVSLDKEHLARLTSVVRTMTPSAALDELNRSDS